MAKQTMSKTEMVLTGAESTSITIRCQVSERLTDKGKIQPVYASVRLEARVKSVEEALEALAELGDAAVKVNIPKLGGEKLNVKVSPIMKAERVACLFAYLGEHELESVDEDTMHEHLTACGVKVGDEVPSANGVK